MKQAKRQLAGSGEALPSGAIGEILQADDGGYVNTTNAAYNLLSLTLTPGVWEVTGYCRWDRNNSTITDANWICSITNQDSNPAEGNLTQLAGGAFTNINVIALISPTLTVSWNGSVNVTPGSVSNTASPIIYLRCYQGNFSGGPVRIWRRIRARRIA